MAVLNILLNVLADGDFVNSSHDRSNVEAI